MHKKLLEIRKKHNLTSKQVAEVLHVSQQQYSLYETGKREIPVSKLIALADFYGVSLDFLVGRDELREGQDGSGTNAG